MNGGAGAGRWLPDGAPAPGAIPLFLLPPAGGSADLFRDPAWAALPAPLLACRVELPGHGGRMAYDPLPTDMDTLVTGLDEACRPRDRTPWAVLGHSMGALVAAAWAARAHRSGHGPCAVYLSAAAPPWASQAAVRLAELNDLRLWDTLSALGGMDPAFAASPVARRLVTRVMRADIATAASWRPSAPESTGCPVVALGGVEDPAVAPDALRAWRGAAVGGFRDVRLPGGHFFRNGLADLAPAVLAAWRGPPGAPHGHETLPDQRDERDAHV